MYRMWNSYRFGFVYCCMEQKGCIYRRKKTNGINVKEMNIQEYRELEFAETETKLSFQVVSLQTLRSLIIKPNNFKYCTLSHFKIFHLIVILFIIFSFKASSQEIILVSVQVTFPINTCTGQHHTGNKFPFFGGVIYRL